MPKVSAFNRLRQAIQTAGHMVMVALCWLLIVVPANNAPAAGLAPPSAPSPEQRAQLSGRALELLRAGRDASAVLAELQAAAVSDAQTSTSSNTQPTATAASDAQSLAQAIALTRSALRPALADNALSPSRAAVLAKLLKTLQAQWLLHQLGFDATEQTLQRLQAGSALARFRAHRAEVEARWSALLAELPALQQPLQARASQAKSSAEQSDLLSAVTANEQSGLKSLDAALALGQPAAEPQAVYGANPLPQQRPGLIAPPLPAPPGIVPSYARGDNPPAPDAWDLTPTDDAPASEAILAQAAALDHDPVRIFDFVRTRIASDFYPGSRKSAEQVLSSEHGNDVDQAHLLIALLRASRAPARYVRGVIEIPAAELAQLLGVPQAQVGRALNAAGTPHEPIISAGRISGWRIEHTWVSAYVPYGHRGNPIDASAPVWLPLAPALKTFASTPATGLLARAGIDSRAWTDQWLASPHDGALPLDALRTELDIWLAAQPGRPDYSTQLSTRVLATLPLDVLPAGLPYPVSHVITELPALAPTRQQRIRLTFHASTDASSPATLDLDLPISQALGRRISLGYAPATVDDALLLNARGALSNIPSYLIQLRPQVWIGGQAMGRSDQGSLVSPGALQRIDLTITTPAGQVSTSQLIRAGSLASLVLAEPGQPPQLETAASAPSADDESQAAALLWNFGARYSADWDRAATELARLTGVQPIAPYPSATLVFTQFKPVQVQGFTEHLQFQGVALDAALRQVEPIATTATGAPETATTEADFLRLTSLHGSALEAATFQAQWQVDASSADRLLQTAASTAVGIQTLQPGSSAGGLAHPASVRDAVQSWLDQGYSVQIPNTTLTAQSWSGTGFRVFKPETGEAGYFLSGGYAGGISITPPELWTLQQLRELLGNPYGGGATQDLSTTALLVIDESTDAQLGMAGTPLAQPLAVYAFDATGRPVQGLSIAFTVSNGDLRIGADLAATASATTDSNGRAQMPGTHPQRLSGNGRYVIPEGKPNAEFRAVSRVAANAVIGERTLQTGRPITVQTVAGLAVDQSMQFYGVNYLESGSLIMLPDIGFHLMTFSVKDEWGNFVANVDGQLSSTMETQSINGLCVASPTYRFPPRFFRAGRCVVDDHRMVDRDCASEVMPVSSEAFPSRVLVTPAGTARNQGVIRLESEGLSSLEQGYLTIADSFQDETVWIGGCLGRDVSDALTSWSYVSKAGWVPAFSYYRQSIYPEIPGQSISIFPIDWAPPGREYLGRFNWYRRLENAPRDAPVKRNFWLPHTSATAIAWDPENPVYRFGVFVAGQFQPLISRHRANDFGFELDFPVSSEPQLMNPEVGGEVPLYEHLFRFPPSRFWSMRPSLVAEPPTLQLTDFGTAAHPQIFRIRIEPADYQGDESVIELRIGDQQLDCAFPFAQDGLGCVIPEGTFIGEQAISARMILNRGTPFEFVSPTIDSPTQGRLIAGFAMGEDLTAVDLAGKFPRNLSVRRDVDLPNRLVCEQASPFQLLLSRRAHVRLTARNRDGTGGTLVLWDAVLDAGRQQTQIHPADVPFGDYTFELHAESDDAPRKTERHEGELHHVGQLRNRLPFGTSMVQGVNLFTGGFTEASADLSIPGRFRPVEFSRAWQSSGGDEIGLLGRGWSTTLDQGIRQDLCGTVVVSGSSGEGQSFIYDRTEGNARHYRGLRGSHGHLVEENNEWDFYSTDGSRYHYAQHSGAGSRFNHPRLSWMADTSGNRITFEYSRIHDEMQVTQIVADPSRILRIEYQTIAVRTATANGNATETLSFIKRVSAAGGIAVEYTVDTDGNLTRVSRGRANQGRWTQTFDYQDFGTLSVPRPGGGLASIRLGWRLQQIHDSRLDTTRTLGYAPRTSEVSSFDGPLPLHELFVSTVTAADGGIWRFGYEGIRGTEEPVTDVIDPLNKTTHYVMNGYGAVLTETSPAGTQATQWNMERLLPAVTTDRIGRITTHSYDDWGNRTAEAVAYGGQTLTRNWTYAANTEFTAPWIRNRVQSETDANGHVTTWTYDPLGRPLTRTQGGITERSAYNETGDLRAQTNGANETVTFVYDRAGRTIRAIGPLSATTERSYDGMGRLVLESDPVDQTVSMIYDDQDRVVQRNDFIGSISIIYDDANRTRIDTDELGRQTTTVADAMGRTVEVRKPLSITETTAYNRVGNPIRREDGNGNATTFVYDDAHRLTEQHEPLGKTTTYTRDGNGQILTETTTGGNLIRTIEREYNHPLGLVTKEDRGEGVIVTNQYDGNGNLLKQIDPRGHATTQVFDERNRRTQKIEPNGRTSTWTYDAADRKTAESHSSGWRRDYEYNALGQLIVERDALGNTTLRSYNKRGDVLSTTDRTGAVITAQYDNRARKTRQDGPVAGKGWSFKYDKVNNLIAEYRNPAYDLISPDNVLNADQNFTYTYDALNRRTRTADQLGTIQSVTYDANGNVLTQTDGNGQQTSFQYNALNQKIRQTAPESRITHWTYTVWGEPLSETMPEGGVTTYQYDATGRKIRTAHPLIDGQTEAALETWQYDPAGNITSQRDADGNSTTFTYDNANRKTRQTDPAPLSFQQTWSYDSENNILSHTDRNATVTTYSYDKENRKIATTRDGLNRGRLAYDGEGRVIESTDPENRTTRFTLDPAGRITHTRLANGILRTATYTPSGDVATTDNGEGQITQYQYDARRRKTSETNPNSETTRFVYDNANNLRRTIGAKFTGEPGVLGVGCIAPTGTNTYLTTFCYDNANRLVNVIDPNGDQTHYDYDRNDNLIGVLEPQNKRSEFQYDARDRRVAKKSADLETGPPQIWTWTYDGTGDVVNETDPSGAISTHSYDVLNRRTQTLIANGGPNSPNQQSVQYDANGNITQRSETTGAQTYSLSFLYDALNRPYQITDSNGRIWRQTFNAADERGTLDSNDIPRVSWNYDLNGRPVQITVEGAGVFDLAYDKADRNTTITNPNGVVTTHQFDAAGRITEIRHTRNGGTVALFQYRYDAHGNRIEQIEENGGAASTTTFSYDQSDRLIAITEPGKHIEYVLDSNGNRIETKEGPTAGQMTKRLVSTFDARNQIVNQKEYNSTGILVATTTFDFDANGNLTRQTLGAAQTQWRYDALDRLIETTPPTGPPTQYRYGPGDVRIATVRAGMETRHHYDGERLVLETNVLGNPQRHYAYSATGLLSTTILSGTPQYRYAHLDAQTSPIAITAANGNILNRSHFDSYGVETNLYGTRDQAISFQGYWSGIELEETGNLLSAARIYIPGLGIYGERDPVEGRLNSPIGFNPYLIGFGNPSRYLDPDGRAPLTGDVASILTEERVNSVARLDSAKDAFWDAPWYVKPALVFGMTLDVGYTASVGLTEGVVVTGDVAADAAITELSASTNIDFGEYGARSTIATNTRNEMIGAAAEGIYEDPLGSGARAAEAAAMPFYKAVMENDTQSQIGIAGGVYAVLRGAFTAMAKPGRAASGARTLAPSNTGPEAHSCPFGQCFVAGTPVLTVSGLKPIETIEVGDLIASRNEITGETRYRRVEKVIITQDRQVIDLDFLDASTGATERITATPNHPFHTPDSAWVEAGALKIGQAVSSHDGRTLTLAARSEHPEGETTYNFTVEEDHTYFVGTSGLWVHNSGGCKACPENAATAANPSVPSPASGTATIVVSRSRFPETAAHIEDAVRAGKPTVLTIGRSGAAARRRESMRGNPPVKGQDRDEYPPAMFVEGGAGSSVRAINPSDNRGAGSCIGAQCRGLPDGTQIEVKIDEE